VGYGTSVSERAQAERASHGVAQPLSTLRRKQRRPARRAQPLAHQRVEDAQLRVAEPGAAPQRPGRLCEPEQPRRRLRVAHIRLGRAEAQRRAVVVEERESEGTGLGRVAERSAGAVRLNSDHRAGRLRRPVRSRSQQRAL
jgi:hypothetical protein